MQQDTDAAQQADLPADGGIGRLARLAGSPPVLVAATLIGAALGFATKAGCRAGLWNSQIGQFQAHCYTDMHQLYFTEGLSTGQIPYFDHPVEYPVLTGGAMEAVSWLIGTSGSVALRVQQFFDDTSALLVLFAIAGVLATAYLAGPRHRWTALLVALSPGLILSAFINWDLIAMGLTAVAMAAWAARRCGLAGVLFGLAIAAKFYPLLLLGPLLMLCLRAGRMRAFWITAGSAAASWLAVNVPVALAASGGWSRFYTMSSDRSADWGSIWYFLQVEHVLGLTSLSLRDLNLAGLGSFTLACLLIAGLIMAAPRRPRVAQVFFLVLAAFLLCNKVWSPQYVIWLVPLAVLARPRLWSYALWQAAEAGYYFAIWAYLVALYGVPGGLSNFLYFSAVLARFGTVLLLCALVTADILRRAADPVRAAGDTDDPAGGVLSGAPDRHACRRRRARLADVPVPALRLPGPGGVTASLSPPTDPTGRPARAPLPTGRPGRRARTGPRGGLPRTGRAPRRPGITRAAFAGRSGTRSTSRGRPRPRRSRPPPASDAATRTPAWPSRSPPWRRAPAETRTSS
jgi:Glycosyltransferase family 87